MRALLPMLRSYAWRLGGLLTGLLVLLLGLAWWLQSEGSLATGLQWAARWLPAGQQLEVQQVRGSLAHGGRIGQLHWRHGSTELALDALVLEWDGWSVFGGVLHVTRLQAKQLHISDPGPAQAGPWSALVLPIRLDAKVLFDTVQWEGPPDLLLHGVQAHYVFDGSWHRVQEGRLSLAAGSYQFQGQLEARGAMAVQARLQGLVQADLAGAPAALSAQAEAAVQGHLGGADAVLQLAAQLQPQNTPAMPAASAMQASLQAQLAPAQAQPLQSVQAQWRGLDLAAFWPQAPHTRLAGALRIQPLAQGWQASVQLQNSAAGTLDQQRLPLESLQTQLVYTQGHWQVTDLQARAGGGSVQGQGAFSGTPRRWSGQAHLRGVQMQRLDARWAAAQVDGTLTAQQQGAGWRFSLQAGTRFAGLGAAAPWRTLELDGAWTAPVWQLDRLLLQGPDGALRGHWTLDSRSYAGQGQLQLQLPGAELALDGALARTQGQGQLHVQVHDAARLEQALQAWPALGLALPQAPAATALDVQLGWRGGWDDLALQWHGQAQVLSRSWHGQGQLRAALARDRVRLDLEQLQLGVADWQAQLSAPVQLRWQPQAGAQVWQLDAGTLRLQGPLPGALVLDWQAAQGQARAGGAWHTQGRWSGLPQAWLERWASTPLAMLGLQGDLLLGGQWDVSGGSSTQLSLVLERSAGDLQLLAQDASGQALAAGVRQARLQLELRGEALHARLDWASANAGNATLDFSTVLQTQGAARWRWAADAPVQARLQAQVPRVGVWSVLAPPGWRVQGSLDADLALRGSRAAPQWRGTLEARDLAVRSVVDGLDFSQGKLQLRLLGQHIDIVDLSCRGAGGASGGSLQASGSLDWAPQDSAGASTGLLNSLRMALNVRASALRVSARADQRLVLSGQVQATLRDQRVSLRGALVADQALFILPEDDAPRLGADVQVHQSALQAPAAPAVRPRAAGPLALDLLLTLDPGSKFQLQGHGLDTRLAGLLTLRNDGSSVAPRLSGELHTVSGSYRAYGQALDIDSGTLRFNGAYDNPALDILALRPNLSQKVGVQVSGTAQLPVLRLWSDPDLPDADKLSWLVLGRAAAAGGAESALLQQAALALWSGKGGAAPWTSVVGLDEVSLGEASSTNPDGSSATATTVKFGKRLSRDFYVAYERSLAGTLGTFYLFYDLSRQLTLRGQSGQQKAADLIYTLRFD